MLGNAIEFQGGIIAKQIERMAEPHDQRMAIAAHAMVIAAREGISHPYGDALALGILDLLDRLAADDVLTLRGALDPRTP